MDDPHGERLKPVYPPIESKTEKSGSTPYQRWSLGVSVITGLASLFVIGLSGYFFLGFADNDQGVWHLLSAFALCFGTGSLAYGPLAAIAFWAHRSKKMSARYSHPYLTTLLVLPWLIVAGLMVPNGEKWVFAAIGIWLLGLLILFWVALSLHQRKGLNSAITEE